MIDWFTIVAQVVNFLILVFLLKRFLYKPILRSIEARRQNIATGFEEARALKEEGEALRAEYEKKNALFEDERDARLNKVRTEVEAERASWMNDAKRQNDEARAQLRTALNYEKRDVQDQLRARARAEAFGLAKKAIADLTSAEIEVALVTRFVEHLSKLSDEQRDVLRRAYEASPAAVLSGTIAPEAAQLEMISKTLNKVMERPVQLSVATSSDSAHVGLAGLELEIGSHRIYWGFDDYLESIEQASIGSDR